jgi:hypothetical protein
MTANFFDMETLDLKAQKLRHDLVDIIAERSTNAPRSLQKELGISDISHPCNRRLAMGILGIPRSNPPYDPLPSIVGTAVHAWLDDAAGYANNQLGRIRWLRETRVNITNDLAGNSDLFDCDTGSVVDHKVLGATSFKKNKKNLAANYRRQIQIYGYGFEKQGHTVNYVGALLIPKSGMLTDAYLHLEPYNRAIVEELLENRVKVISLINDLDVENNLHLLEIFEKQGPGCMFCKWFSPKPQGPLECEGVDD